MNIKGKYQDILKQNGKVLWDFGWKSNEIVQDYGRFLAALMKRDFDGQVGIEYIAVGNYADLDIFKGKALDFFNWCNQGDSGPLWSTESAGSTKKWIWAKKIEPGNMKYLDQDDNEIDTITDKLKIDITFIRMEPSEETFDFKEFALVGIYKDPDSNLFDTTKMFFINYVNHGQIIKDNSMELSRTIKLTFPIIKEESIS